MTKNEVQKNFYAGAAGGREAPAAGVPTSRSLRRSPMGINL